MVKTLLTGSALCLALGLLSCEDSKTQSKREPVNPPEPKVDVPVDTTQSQDLTPEQQEALLLAQDILDRQMEVLVAFSSLSFSKEKEFDGSLAQLERLLSRQIAYLKRMDTPVKGGQEAIDGLVTQLEFIQSELQATIEPTYRTAMKAHGGAPPEGGWQSALDQEFISGMEKASDAQVDPWLELLRIHGLEMQEEGSTPKE